MKRIPKLLEIHMIGDKILRQKAEPVEEITDEIREFIQDLTETMYTYDGVGLAAPQVGRSLRIFVVDPFFYETKVKKPIVMINPHITESDGSFVYEEGCLSLPDIFEKVKRPGRVVIESIDPKGEKQVYEAEDYFSTVIQHENDHLDGILFVDRVNKLKLLPWKRKIRELESMTDEHGVNIRKFDK